MAIEIISFKIIRHTTTELPTSHYTQNFARTESTMPYNAIFLVFFAGTIIARSRIGILRDKKARFLVIGCRVCSTGQFRSLVLCNTLYIQQFC